MIGECRSAKTCLLDMCIFTTRALKRFGRIDQNTMLHIRSANDGSRTDVPSQEYDTLHAAPLAGRVYGSPLLLH